MNLRWMAVACASLLLVASCSKSEGKSGRLTDASTALPTSSAAVGPSGSAPAAPRASGKAPSAPVASANASTRTGSSGSSGASGEVSPSGPAQPKVGAYTFHEKGTRRAGSAGQSQPYEEDGTLNVSRSGSDATLSYQNSQGKEDMTLRFERDRVLLTHVMIQQSIGSFGGDLQPPPMVVRWPVRVGDSWSGSWTANGTSGKTSVRVDRSESMSAMGSAWKTYVLETTTTTTGQASGTTKVTSWYAPDLGLDLRRVSDFSGSYQGVPFQAHSDQVITSRP